MAVSIDRQMDMLRRRKAQLQSEIERIEQVEQTLERTVEEAIRAIDSAGHTLASGAKSAAGSVRRRAASATGSKPAAKRKPAKRAASGTGRRGRPKGSGKRQAQAVKIISSTPGIRTSEVAKKMGIGPNYLYRLLPDLAKDGLVVKRGSGWYPAGEANTATK